MLEPYCAGNVPNEALMLRSPSAPKPAFGCSAMARGRASRSTRAGATPRRGSRRRLRRLLTMRVRGLSDVGRNRFIAPFMRRADRHASMDACLPNGAIKRLRPTALISNTVPSGPTGYPASDGRAGTRKPRRSRLLAPLEAACSSMACNTASVASLPLAWANELTSRTAQTQILRLSMLM